MMKGDCPTAALLLHQGLRWARSGVSASDPSALSARKKLPHKHQRPSDLSCYGRTTVALSFSDTPHHHPLFSAPTPQFVGEPAQLMPPIHVRCGRAERFEYSEMRIAHPTPMKCLRAPLNGFDLLKDQGVETWRKCRCETKAREVTAVPVETPGTRLRYPQPRGRFPAKEPARSGRHYFISRFETCQSRPTAVQSVCTSAPRWENPVWYTTPDFPNLARTRLARSRAESLSGVNP
jgi:hypothetical protein